MNPLKPRLLSSLLIFMMFACVPAMAQLGFTPKTDVPVDEFGKNFNNAWTGGFNNAQLANADLNNDGIDDLVVFDRTGDAVVTYLNDGTSGAIDMEYAPKYAYNFPAIEHFMLMEDFNCDGIMDLFSSTPGRVDYYLGYYTSDDELAFNYIDFLKFESFSGDLNIFVSSQDIPAISDVNGDGDLDLLTFHQLGSFLEYYENQSIERTGACYAGDTTVFKVVTDCYGKIKEPGLSNVIVLDDTCWGGNIVSDQGGQRHSGSTLLSFDQDGDGDEELFLGDLTFSNVVGLHNGGTPDSAHFTAQDTFFPSYDISVDMRYYPANFYVDVNNDGRKDFISSPNARNISENFRCVSYYENVGTGNTQIFEHRTDTFLNNNSIDMGEGSNPAFLDHNADGLLDIVIGNGGYYKPSGNFKGALMLLENTGTASDPEYTIVNRDYANLSSLGLNSMVPAFADMDDDGDVDMILGEKNGYLHYFTNTAGAGNTANFQLAAAQFMSIDVGEFSAPFIGDFNGDGLKDLLVGDRQGRVEYFENKGSVTSPVFPDVATTVQLGGVDVRAPGFLTGYAYPWVGYLDSTMQPYLMVGAENGRYYLYEFDSTKLYADTFVLVTKSYSNIDVGYRSTMCVADIDGDTTMEMICGNYRGGLSMFTQSADAPIISVKNIEKAPEFVLYPNPAVNTIVLAGDRLLQYESVEVRIFDMMGREVYRNDLPAGTERMVLPISNLNKGVFICRVELEGYTWTQRFIIQE